MKTTTHKPFRFFSATLFSIIVATLLLLNGCNKQDVLEQGKINYVKVTLGGCNLGFESENTSMELPARIPSNTNINTTNVLITHTNDSINVHIDHYYICKFEPFETEVKVTDEEIIFYLKDICEEENISDCYARCTCSYTFDFVFNYQSTINQAYKVILISPREEEPIVIYEGIIRV